MIKTRSIPELTPREEKNEAAEILVRFVPAPQRAGGLAQEGRCARLGALSPRPLPAAVGVHDDRHEVGRPCVSELASPATFCGRLPFKGARLVPPRCQCRRARSGAAPFVVTGARYCAEIVSEHGLSWMCHYVVGHAGGARELDGDHFLW
jgi:hypothetical protein